MKDKLQDKLIRIDLGIMKEITSSPDVDVLGIIKDVTMEYGVDLYEYSEYLEKNSTMRYKLGKELARQNYDTQKLFKESSMDLF